MKLKNLTKATKIRHKLDRVVEQLNILQDNYDAFENKYNDCFFSIEAYQNGFGTIASVQIPNKIKSIAYANMILLLQEYKNRLIQELIELGLTDI